MAVGFNSAFKGLNTESNHVPGRHGARVGQTKVWSS